MKKENYSVSYNPSEEETAERRNRARKITEQNERAKDIPGGPYKKGGARPAGRKM